MCVCVCVCVCGGGGGGRYQHVSSPDYLIQEFGHRSPLVHSDPMLYEEKKQAYVFLVIYIVQFFLHIFSTSCVVI